MLDAKAYVHWYTKFGLELSDFEQGIPESTVSRYLLLGACSSGRLFETFLKKKKNHVVLKIKYRGGHNIL